MYQADGYAVKELLKIASVLYSSMQHADDDELLVAGQIDVSAVYAATSPPIINQSINQSIIFHHVHITFLHLLLTLCFVRTSSEVRSIREIARELTQRGAVLHELLGSEEQLRLARQSALARNPDLKEIENHISRTVSAISSELQGTERQIQSLLQDQRTLDGKIEKKRQDLERYEKRLRSLQTVPCPHSCRFTVCFYFVNQVRPAYMDEYELLEVELSDLFRIYLEKHRNLDYLQSQLDSHKQREKERMDENERKMREIQRKIKDDELSMMRGEREIVEGGLEDEFDLDEDSDSLQVPILS
jgi:clusterin-associated protein 1